MSLQEVDGHVAVAFKAPQPAVLPNTPDRQVAQPPSSPPQPPPVPPSAPHMPETSDREDVTPTAG